VLFFKLGQEGAGVRITIHSLMLLAWLKMERGL
jgi:hypothetical protein